ncbi:MAG: hypothetical protein AAGK14_15075 [Verrucomicrobiota bacterium]
MARRLHFFWTHDRGFLLGLLALPLSLSGLVFYLPWLQALGVTPANLMPEYSLSGLAWLTLLSNFVLAAFLFGPLAFLGGAISRRGFWSGHVVFLVTLSIVITALYLLHVLQSHEPLWYQLAFFVPVYVGSLAGAWIPFLLGRGVRWLFPPFQFPGLRRPGSAPLLGSAGTGTVI